jgi:glycerol kinase
MAGLGVGVWSDLHDIDDLWQPARIVEPGTGIDHAARRERWHDAVDRAAGWHRELSALDF